MNEVDLLIESSVREQATWIEIDRTALRHNLARIISLTLPSATIMAIVKANAYGHGLYEVAQCLKEQVSYFGVASIEEAIVLAIQSEITIVVSSVEQAKEISEWARKLKKFAKIHIKIDTGMGRLGIPLAAAVEAVQEIAAFNMLELEGIFTHFPQGEEEQDSFTQGQIRSFNQILQQLSQQGIRFTYCHAANSTGIAKHKDSHFNLVRPGLTLYGLYPHSSLKQKLKLKPVLSWRARLILIKKLAPGESTGYGRTFIAKEETTIGIIPVGYSHGYPFALSNKGIVLFQGKRYLVAGRISMDYVAINFGPHFSKAKTGDTVTLLGREEAEEISAETLAELAGTIPYEIVTRLNPSIPRILV